GMKELRPLRKLGAVLFISAIPDRVRHVSLCDRIERAEQLGHILPSFLRPTLKHLCKNKRQSRTLGAKRREKFPWTVEEFVLLLQARKRRYHDRRLTLQQFQPEQRQVILVGLRVYLQAGIAFGT